MVNVDGIFEAGDHVRHIDAADPFVDEAPTCGIEATAAAAI